jgi:hypothetical protein
MISCIAEEIIAYVKRQKENVWRIMKTDSQKKKEIVNLQAED